MAKLEKLFQSEHIYIYMNLLQFLRNILKITRPEKYFPRAIALSNLSHYISCDTHQSVNDFAKHV